MTDPRADASSTGGLRHILAATVIAGGIGYLIQFLVPVFSPGSYLDFATAWSAIYLVVTCLSGIQQELTRASRRGASGSGFQTWVKFTVIAAVVATTTVVAIFSFGAPRLFSEDSSAFVGILAVGAFGYCLVSAVSGAVYGLKDWNAVAGMTIADSIIRALMITAALLAGGAAVLLGWATALPFLLAAVAIWAWVGRRIKDRLVVDVPLARLFRNSSATVLASLSTGLLISGLPLLLKAFVPDAGADVLASLILVITLTRAPLVVPLLALQGYLVVSFRDTQHSAAARALRWVAVVLTAVVLLAGLAAFLGPPLMSWLFSDFPPVSPLYFAIIVLSAGLTGVMCITGPAVLAANRHAWYTTGWAVSAVMTVLVLLLPIDASTRIITALLGGPLMGAIVHVISVRAQRPSSPLTAG